MMFCTNKEGLSCLGTPNQQLSHPNPLCKTWNTSSARVYLNAIMFQARPDSASTDALPDAKPTTAASGSVRRNLSFLLVRWKAGVSWMHLRPELVFILEHFPFFPRLLKLAKQIRREAIGYWLLVGFTILGLLLLASLDVQTWSTCFI